MSNERPPKYRRGLQIRQQFQRLHLNDIDTTLKIGIDQGSKSANHSTDYSNQSKRDIKNEQERTTKISNGKQDIKKPCHEGTSFLPNVYSTDRDFRTYSRQWVNNRRQNYETSSIKKEDTTVYQANQTQVERQNTKEETIHARAYHTSTFIDRVGRGTISNFSNNLQQDRISKDCEEFKKPETLTKEQPIITNTKGQMKGRKTPQGLPNIGNTCYANSLLQVLSQTPDLFEKVLLCAENSSPMYNLKKSHVTNTFCNLLRSMNSSNRSPKSFTIAAFMDMVSKRDREFSIGYQNDCHSFFLTLLSELHDENPGKDLARIFEMEMVDEFTFDSCTHRDVTDTQIMRSLTIPSGSPCVEDGLLDLLYEEVFDESEVPCRDCNLIGYGKTRKAMKFCHLPRAIVLQLGCFQESGRPATYHLYGVVNHHGSTYGGHYTAYVKHLSNLDGGQWYSCNDSQVRSSSLSEALGSSDAYLLFYKL
ncbi:ubiquitin carboxyl-terminal hydrolase 15-like isoform X2 [Saccostrea cucullata]|uniref:ubiquitin carboxyl-terminal hydrolase 15-like isoform X2 n=1 Tax=Saccostrea cuccullata TaxID=36930 RepID=UPI002ED67499